MEQNREPNNKLTHLRSINQQENWTATRRRIEVEHFSCHTQK